MHTPWGQSDSIDKIADGICFVTTPRHGGFKLDAAQNEQVPLAWRKASFNGQGLKGWYEEDCDWVFVALTFPQFFSPGELASARAAFPLKED